MAELISYDPSTDPQAVQAAVERDAESLAKHEEYEAERQNPYAGKYDSPEQLEQAYLELQKKLGQDGGDEGEPEQDAELDESEVDDSDDPDEIDTDAPLMEVMDLLNEEYDETGTLSEESIEALSELPAEDLVQAYLQYQDKLGSMPTGREMTDAEVASVYDMAGGQEQYEAMTEWASQNFGHLSSSGTLHFRELQRYCRSQSRPFSAVSHSGQSRWGEYCGQFYSPYTIPNYPNWTAMPTRHLTLVVLMWTSKFQRSSLQ